MHVNNTQRSKRACIFLFPLSPLFLNIKRSKFCHYSVACTLCYKPYSAWRRHDEPRCVTRPVHTYFTCFILWLSLCCSARRKDTHKVLPCLDLGSE